MTRTSSYLAVFSAIGLLSTACVSGASDSGTGGTPGSGGDSGSGGSSSGGKTGSGGASSSGGTTGSGGASSASGGSSTGGASSGGATGSGGKASSGGASASGGTVGGGGATAHGGSTGTTSGGATGTAGAKGSGGVTAGGGSIGSGGGASGTPTGENMGSACGATAAPNTKTDMKLPNPFTMHDGTTITTKAQWECRRAEIKADLEKYEIGPKQDPSTSTVKATLSGKSLSVAITTTAGTMTLTSTVSGSGSCILIGLDNPTGLVTGCTSIPFTSSQVVKSEQDSTQYQTDPFYKVYPSLWKMIGNYSAWSWGVSRLIDGIEQVKSQLNVDTTKIAVHGCSYAGKMALFSGALDERVALTVVEESGGGGINSWRTSDEFVKNGGPSIEKIDNTNYGWFLPSMQKLSPYTLPHDHHELISLIAPRATIILGNDNYDWLGDESGYKSTMAAIQVFTAMGVADHIGYDFTSNSGQAHCGPPATQKASVATFVQKFLQGGTGASNVAIKPPKSSFDLNWQAVVDWTPPLPTLN
ncbi:MAG TPA: hypothetical protein VGP07_10490 [Polyangia bacterium]|jgi:hypothetical protein